MMTAEQIEKTIAGIVGYERAFSSDLNAMHEAEAFVPVELRARWYLYLCAASGDNAWRTSRATAAQRAEAFLRALGKWDESA